MYRRMQGYPRNEDTPNVRLEKERAIFAAFMQYLASSSNFAGFKEEQAKWEMLMVCYPLELCDNVPDLHLFAEKGPNCSLDCVSKPA